MATKKEETASFVIRFTQKIFDDEKGEPTVQWRGNIRHVQTGNENRFSNFEEARTFVQDKLSELTLQAIEHQSPEIQKGILAKSFDLWKKVAANTPKMVLESIKDPKKQVAHIQEQIQEKLENVGDKIGHKLESTFGQKIDLDQLKFSSKNDFNAILTKLDEMSSEMNKMNKKMVAMEKKLNQK